jgi:hypothetical protein
VRDATFYVLIATTTALAMYDLFAVLRAGPHSSISAVLYYVAKEHPIVPFVLGVLLGHVFWPNVR